MMKMAVAGGGGNEIRCDDERGGGCGDESDDSGGGCGKDAGGDVDGSGDDGGGGCGT